MVKEIQQVRDAALLMFASAALTGILAGRSPGSEVDAEILARESFEVAEYMLGEAKKQGVLP